jgi:hypothetical protein
VGRIRKENFMAASDLKTMTKQSLEKNRIFFDEAISKIEDLRFYASRFGGSCDDLLLKQIDLYISELQQLKKTIVGAGASTDRS